MEAHAEIDWLWMAFKILAVLLLVALNGFFVAAEFALVKVRGTQLQPLVYEGQRRAKVAHYILNNLDAFLSACQLGITLASLALGWIGEPIFETLLQPIFHWLAIESENSEVNHLIRIRFLCYYSITYCRRRNCPQVAGHSETPPNQFMGCLSDDVVLQSILSISGGSQLGFSTTSQTCRNRSCYRIARASFRRGTAPACCLEQGTGQALPAWPRYRDERARPRQPHRTRSHAAQDKYRRAGHQRRNRRMRPYCRGEQLFPLPLVRRRRPRPHRRRRAYQGYLRTTTPSKKSRRLAARSAEDHLRPGNVPTRKNSCNSSSNVNFTSRSSWMNSEEQSV